MPRNSPRITCLLLIKANTGDANPGRVGRKIPEAKAFLLASCALATTLIEGCAFAHENENAQSEDTQYENAQYENTQSENMQSEEAITDKVGAFEPKAAPIVNRNFSKVIVNIAAA